MSDLSTMTSTDPLSLARIAMMKGATVVKKDDFYVFGSMSYPLKVETCFRRTLTSAKTQYYTLKDVFFYMECMVGPETMSIVDYRRAAVKERCLAVVEADAKDLVAYLSGEVDTVSQLDPAKAAEIAAQYSTATKTSSSHEHAERAVKSTDKNMAKSDADAKIDKLERTDDEKALRRKRKIGLINSDGGPVSLSGADGFEMASVAEIHASKRRMLERNQTSVADRVSVLRNSKADYSFITNEMKQSRGLYDVVMSKRKADEAAAEKLEGSSKKKVLPAMNTVMKPIIVIPSAFGSIINSTNAREMLQDNSYIPLEEARARGMERVTEQTILRKIPGSNIELPYKLIDNPTKLADEEWKSVVAVFATGQAWQFKGWKWAEPRQLFANVLGVHICVDDTAISENILQWSCKVLQINRSKRHSDAIAMNKFWEHVDQFVKIHRPEIQKEIDNRKAQFTQ